MVTYRAGVTVAHNIYLLVIGCLYISDLMTYHMHVFPSKAVATPNLQHMYSLLASQKQFQKFTTECSNNVIAFLQPIQSRGMGGSFLGRVMKENQ